MNESNVDSDALELVAEEFLEVNIGTVGGDEKIIHIHTENDDHLSFI
jgi:hypothetical protein